MRTVLFQSFLRRAFFLGALISLDRPGLSERYPAMSTAVLPGCPSRAPVGIYHNAHTRMLCRNPA